MYERHRFSKMVWSLKLFSKGQGKSVLIGLIKPKSFTSTKTENKILTLFRLLFGLLFRTAATTAAIWSIRNRHTVHTAVIKVTLHVNIVLFTLKKERVKKAEINIRFCSPVHKWPENYLDVISETLQLKLEPGREKNSIVVHGKRLKDECKCELDKWAKKSRTEGLTEERFLLLLKPPSLIFRGATFLVFTFFSWGLGAGLDFLRALGPEMRRN